MRAGDFLSGGVARKFNVFIAKEAGHFQVFGLLQRDCCLAVRTWDFLPDVLNGKLNVDATGMTRHFYGFDCLRQSAFQPKPHQRRITARHQGFLFIRRLRGLHRQKLKSAFICEICGFQAQKNVRSFSRRLPQFRKSLQNPRAARCSVRPLAGITGFKEIDRGRASTLHLLQRFPMGFNARNSYRGILADRGAGVPAGRHGTAKRGGGSSAARAHAPGTNHHPANRAKFTVRLSKNRYFTQINEQAPVD